MKKLLRRVVAILSCGVVSAATTTTENFGVMSMNFVAVGDAGNAADADTNGNRLGRGAVAYNYRIGQTEVSEGQIAAYNADAANSANLITLDSRGTDSPATGVSWNEAARFVNWMNTSQGYQEAYKFNSTGGNANITLWSSGDIGYDASNAYRNSEAHYYLPSVDEWYKAAYYQGDGTYDNWATGDTEPTAVPSGTTTGTAVYNGQSAPAVVGSAGGLSHYGAMAQSGNAWEWQEDAYDGVNDTAAESRELRGGSWFDSSIFTSASYSAYGSPSNEFYYIGFRVAAVPEPSAWLLSMVGGMTLLVRRRRG